MKPEILLVNPPVYDFSAYDFWLKPYGLLSIAGYLRGKASFKLFDYLDRQHPFMAEDKEFESDKWGKGRFYEQQIPSPEILEEIRRHYRRFGLPREYFRKFLQENNKFDFALIQTTMTYWYLGVKEVIEDIREICPETKIALGGNYVTLCGEHAKTLGADMLVYADKLEPLWEFLNLAPDYNEPALWESYPKLISGVTKLSDGCPFNCSYCSVPKIYGKFKARPSQRALAEFKLLKKLGVKNLAFYDDALLYNARKLLIPYLKTIIKAESTINLHSPNALNARFVTRNLAETMVAAGFKTFYLGFESISNKWQKSTGSKVFSEELTAAVENLTAAGAKPTSITAYSILGHPNIDIQNIEESMRFVNSLGIRGMLADFAPLPGTSDGEKCRKWIDLDEPLMHNKTAFAIIRLGFEELNRLKDIQRKLNLALAQ